MQEQSQIKKMTNHTRTLTNPFFIIKPLNLSKHNMGL